MTTIINLIFFEGSLIAAAQLSLLQVIFAFQPESLEAGDETGWLPFEGFNILAIGALLLTVALVIFVILKVVQRMNKSDRG